VADATLMLNARIGRRSPRFMPVPVAPPVDMPRARWLALHARLPGAAVLLLALALALWPHWGWMARRMTDGSDEPWGVLALITVFVLVARDWRALARPSNAALIVTAALALTAAVARWWLPPLVAGAIAMAALATFLAGARPDRPAMPLATLLLLALPLIASLQFYFGYPLRLATAVLAAPVLRALGYAVEAMGAAFAYHGRLVLVDPPCAGIGMLWVGAYTAALLSYLGNASAARTLVNGTVAAACVFIANVVRNVLLFFPEALALRWPQQAHALTGLVTFGVALVPLVLVARWAEGRKGARWPAWPPRHHRQVA